MLAIFQPLSSCAFQYIFPLHTRVVTIARAYDFCDLKVGQFLVMARLQLRKCRSAYPNSVLASCRCALFQSANILCARTRISSSASTTALISDICYNANNKMWQTSVMFRQMSNSKAFKKNYEYSNPEKSDIVFAITVRTDWICLRLIRFPGGCRKSHHLIGLHTTLD